MIHIESGKYYRKANGEKVGPMIRHSCSHYPWVSHSHFGESWSANGDYHINDEPVGSLSDDLIEECLPDDEDIGSIKSETPAEPHRLPLSAPGYEPLYEVLCDAHDQAAHGKGRDRHAGGKPFLKQPIMEIGRMVGLGYQTGQAMKKTQEAVGMLARGRPDQARAELLGAINYLAAAVIQIDETTPDAAFPEAG